MIKILHTADLHLDSPFSSGIVDPKIRQQDLRDTFLNIVGLAITNEVQLVLIPGDLFDNEFVTNETQKFLALAMQKAHNIQFFITPGNHDYYSRTSIFASNEYPENVYIFKNSEIECVDIEKLNVSVYGFACVSPNSERHYLKDFKVNNNERINIMLFHGELVNSNEQSTYYPLTKEEISFSGLDYIALGHIHKYSEILSEKDTCFAYPGCPEGRGFDELSDRGVILGLVGKKKHSLNFIPVNKRKYDIITVDISGATEHSFIKEKTNEQLINKTKNDIVRIVLTGQVSSELLINSSVLLDDFDNVFYLEIKDNTSIKEDIESYLNENTLRGLFAKKIFEKMNNATEGEKPLYEKALKYGLATLRGEEVAGYDN